jgi:hypothetical protein
MPPFGREEFSDGLLEFWKICVPFGNNIYDGGDGRLTSELRSLSVNREREREIT